MISNSEAAQSPLPDPGGPEAETGRPSSELCVAPRRRGRPSAGGREAILAAALTLLRERGIARVTSREVAVLARVSEASVFYHYKDRAGLLQAVFEQGLQPLRDLAERGLSGADVHDVLTSLGTALERFLDQALPIMTAAQSDAALRDALAAYMSEHDLGPHRGVRALGDYLAAEQAAGRVRAGADPHAVAMMFVGACYTRASQRQLAMHAVELPTLQDVTTATERLLLVE
jgi:AcrR family transcriptional regulator